MGKAKGDYHKKGVTYEGQVNMGGVVPRKNQGMPIDAKMKMPVLNPDAPP